ncbi:ABC transporter substrate-binding protein [Parathalassolituus penaei]|uniref:ABC transporter substrate-binding protein n=1 Tax=Parathalassolituus penaei TaxID=2997323 RepID=A0A9X3ITX1_9GAMM|nr:ABC transporter substrate-binding protein [Parathalassolituus penaei]MCY0966339.1 ABC transporter substrate-binding protein [Parathalassolituus penaei]
MMDNSRRKFLKNTLLASSAVMAASASPWVRAGRDNTFKIGFVSPQTGPLAAFAEPDMFIMEQVRKLTANGIMSGGQKYAVEIIYKDSQSNPNQAGKVTSELILRDGVDLVIASATPATTNPVADQCEANGVPCITNDTPWQAHFFGRKGDPKVGFDWTYHFFWGLEDVIGSYTNLWQKLPTNKSIGTLWPNDEDGNAWGNTELGFPSALNKSGFSFIDRGRFQTPVNDFSSFISEFRKQEVEIVTGVITPPDFANFWNQAGQQGFQPKIVTVAKATEFPQAVAAFGPRAEGLTVEMWWSPAHPFNSSISQQSAAELAAAYSAATSRAWSMPLGLKHSLFEVALDVLQRAGSKDPEAIRDAIKATNLNTVVGPVNFANGPVPNIGKTPLVTGQWQRKGDKLDLVIVENSQAPMIPLQAELLPIKYS